MGSDDHYVPAGYPPSKISTLLSKRIQLDTLDQLHVRCLGGNVVWLEIILGLNQSVYCMHSQQAADGWLLNVGSNTFMTTTGLDDFLSAKPRKAAVAHAGGFDLFVYLPDRYVKYVECHDLETTTIICQREVYKKKPADNVGWDSTTPKAAILPFVADAIYPTDTGELYQDLMPGVLRLASAEGTVQWPEATDATTAALHARLKRKVLMWRQFVVEKRATHPVKRLVDCAIESVKSQLALGLEPERQRIA